MRGKNGVTWVVMLLATLMVTLPARAIVIEDLVMHHPLVALVSSREAPAEGARASTPPVPPTESGSLFSLGTHNLPTPADATVSPDNMTVEVIPIHLPKLPSYMVFGLYLVGATVFYTLLVLIAQPGPAEYY